MTPDNVEVLDAMRAVEESLAKLKALLHEPGLRATCAEHWFYWNETRKAFEIIAGL